MTISEKMAERLLKITIWVVIGYAVMGALGSAYRLFNGGKFDILMLIPIWLVYVGFKILKRDNYWRKTLLACCWVIAVLLLFLDGNSLVKNGTFFPAGFNIVYQVSFGLLLLGNIWTLMVLHHPAVKRIFTKQNMKVPEWKLYRQDGPPLLPGYFLDFDHASGFRNHTGGENKHADAICPICGRKLILYLHLDLAAPELAALRIPARRKELDFYYCMRCYLLESDFQYRVDPKNGNFCATQFDQKPEGYSYGDEWKEEFNDCEFLPERSFGLAPISSEIQEFLEKSSEDYHEYFLEYKDAMAPEMKDFWDPNADYSGPNQVGGKLYLLQNVNEMECAYCRELHRRQQKMSYIITLANRPSRSIKIAYDGVQILFAICPACGSIGAGQSCD